MMKKIKLLLLLILVWSPLSSAGNKDVNTYIKSMDGVKEVPFSILINERSKGSEIYKAYNMDSLLDVPHRRKKAHYFPVAGKSLDSIICFLQCGRLDYKLSHAESLCDDVKICQLSEMGKMLEADIKEKKMLKAYPELRKLADKSSDIYPNLMLTVAAFRNDLTFFQYLMSKYHLEGKLLFKSLIFDLENRLGIKSLPLAKDDFVNYKLSETKNSILRIIIAVDDKRNGILAYLLEQEIVTEEDIRREISRFQTGHEEINTSSGVVYKRIIYNSILGDDAWLNILSGVAWSSMAKTEMTYDQAIKYCEEVLVTDLSLGLKCHLPSVAEYEQIGRVGDRAYEVLPNFKDHWFWSSDFSDINHTEAYVFLGSEGNMRSVPRSLNNSVRCVCAFDLEK